jgi:uncharacterized membrane protein
VESIRNHFWRHGRFYTALALGVAVWFATMSLRPAARFLSAADASFALYLVTMAFVVVRTTPDALRERAAIEDEGILLVLLIALVVIGASSLDIVTVLKQKHGTTPLELVLAFAGIPLGWFTLHTIAAFHYADLYYARKESGPQSVRGLDFPHTKEPGVWDFLYYAFTVAMTAQTSDTDILDMRMRRATLGHAVVSFFYYAGIIAMGVNAVVNLASS